MSLPQPPTTIDILRHGEVQGGPCYRGSTDDELTPLGVQQMWRAIGDQRPWSKIITSNLRRCRGFAQELTRTGGLPLLIDARWREIHFGAWDGKSADELLRTDSRALRDYWDDPLNHTPPQAECFANFQARVLNAWEELLGTSKTQHVLLITHAGVLRLILSHVLQMPPGAMFQLHVPDACLSRVHVVFNGAAPVPRVVFHAGRL